MSADTCRKLLHKASAMLDGGRPGADIHFAFETIRDMMMLGTGTLTSDEYYWFCSRSDYVNSPYLSSPISYPGDTVIKILGTVCEEMERRIKLFDESGVKSFSEYNESMSKGKPDAPVVPFLIVIIDEFEELPSEQMPEFKYWIKRITAVARFLGIHLVMTTKHTSSDVLSTEIRYNIPSWVQFFSDGNNLVLDNDASKLESRGDLLFRTEGSDKSLRLQGAFVNV